MLDFQNVEKKLKSLAEIILIISIVLSCILLAIFFAIAVESANSLLLLIGPIVSGLTILSSYVSCLFIYGFGQLIEHTKKE